MPSNTYDILQAQTVMDLILQTNDRMRNKWVPLGPPSYVVSKMSITGESGILWFQAMTREDPKPNLPITPPGIQA